MQKRESRSISWASENGIAHLSRQLLVRNFLNQSQQLILLENTDLSLFNITVDFKLLNICSFLKFDYRLDG